MFGVNVVRRQQARQAMALKQARVSQHRPRETRGKGNDAARAKQMTDLRKWAFEGIDP
jgi:hypothetical protein